MSLDLPQILPQIDAMGQSLARRAEALAQKLPAALQELQAMGLADRQALLERVKRAGDNWSGASPTEEPSHQTFPPPTHPPELHVLAADGSQIYPDRHAASFYFLINVGGIHIHHGSGRTPETSSAPRLFFEEEDLYLDDGSSITSEFINGMRDAAEMGELARMAEACAGQPTLALLDNGLLLWLTLQVRDQHRKQADRILRQYLEHLDRLKAAAAALAGFVDRPRNANVLALLHLSTLSLEGIQPDNLRTHPFQGLTDRALFAQHLPPGHRSARFSYTSRVYKDFSAAGHEVQFFYLNTGVEDHGPQSGEPQIARVEVPTWVAENPERLGWVHSGILEQCRSTGGFPYALVRAHELAVVGHAERQAVQELLGRALLRHGLQPRISQKALTKRWTGPRRRHRL